MTHKTTPLFFLIFFLSLPLAHSQEFRSVLQFGDTGGDGADAIDTDASGNKYVLGSFSGTTAFGSTTLTSDGGVDIVVFKISANDDVLWANKIGSSADNEIPTDIKVDASGDVYVIGSYGASVTLYDDKSNIQLNNSYTNQDVFFAHYDGDGELQDAGNFDLNLFMTPQALDVTSTGEVYATGRYQSLSADIWVSRLPLNGITSWFEVIGGTGLDVVNTLSVDDNGHINIGGYFVGTLALGSFSTTTITSVGLIDGFILSLNDNISLESLFHIPCANSTSQVSVDHLYRDGNDIYLAGSFRDEITIGSTSLKAAGDYFHAFYSKLSYTSATDVYQVEYAQMLDGTANIIPTALGVNSKDEMCLTGRFEETINYGKAESIKSTGSYDLFYAQIEEDGDVDFMLSAGSLDNVLVNDLCINGDEVTLTGSYSSDLSFSGTDITSAGEKDMFIVDVFDLFPAVNLEDVPVLLCQNQELELEIKAKLMEAGNVFNVYLSDENGDFGNQTLIGSLTSTTSGFITVTLSNDLNPSATYQVSVESTKPALTAIYDDNIEISPLAEDLSVVGKVKVDALSQETYSVKDIPGTTYYWEVDNGNQLSGDNGNSIVVQWANDGQGRIRVYHMTEAGCESNEKELLVGVGSFVSVPETAQELSLYPVPTQNELVIEGMTAQNPVQHYAVYDLTGKVMLTQEFAGGTSATQLKVDVSHLQTGVYFVKMQMNDEVVVKEFQKL